MHKLRLTLMTLGHLAVDGVASTVTPLVRIFKQQFELSYLSANLIVAAMSIGASLSQPLFAYLCDRKDRSWLVPAGTLVACLGIGATVWMDSYAWVLVMILIANLGVAAFHPQAALLARQYAGRRRILGMSILMCGGVAGLTVGPIAVTQVVDAYSLKHVTLLALPGLALVPFLLAGSRPVETDTQREQRLRARVGFWGRRPRAVALLFAMSILRASAVTGYVSALAVLSDEQKQHLTTTGYWASVFLASGGLAALVVGLTVRRGREKWPAFVTFLVAGPALVGFAFCWRVPALGLVLLGLAGAASQASVPLFISMCQRLMPQRAAMASALMMGASWGLGGACSLAVGAIADAWHTEIALVGLGVLMAPTAALALWLPKRPAGLAARRVIAEAASVEPY